LTVLTDSRWYEARRRWQRNAAYVLLAQAAAAAMLILGARDTLAAQATVGLLLPVVAWLAVRMWRAMTTCSVAAVALDDIAVPVMLGLPLMALLVWLPDRLDYRDIELLADALHIPPAGVATVREALRLAGKYAELPQRWWIGLYVLLVGVSLLFAMRPGLLPAVVRWFTQLRIVPLLMAGHRHAPGVQVGLLVGAVAPTAVAPGRRARLAANYTENLPRRGGLAAYAKFQRGRDARPTAIRATRYVPSVFPCQAVERLWVRHSLDLTVWRALQSAAAADSGRSAFCHH
jgi:hypothetical protein